MCLLPRLTAGKRGEGRRAEGRRRGQGRAEGVRHCRLRRRWLGLGQLSPPRGLVPTSSALPGRWWCWRLGWGQRLGLGWV